MGSRWQSAQRCHTALSVLLSELQHSHRRTSSDAFGGDDFHGPAPKLRRIDPGLSPAESKPIHNERDQGMLGVSNAAEPTFSDAMPDMDGWDASDFFRDLSWNNLFDIGDMAQASDLPFFPG